jgi:HK97 gp10 family phage protein
MAVKLIFNRKEVSRRAQVGISLALEAFAVNVWSTARKGCPIKTGSLRNSIRIEKSAGMNINYVFYRVVAGAGDFEGSGMRMVGAARSGVGVGIQKGIRGGKWRRPFYALYVELGTSRMAARPFMRNAFNRHKNGLRQAVRRFMRL